jgi:hypothetical protein
VVHEIRAEWLSVHSKMNRPVVRGSKPLLHCHSWLCFGKFQDTEHRLIPCPRHVLSWLLPCGETCRYTTAPSTQKNLERFSVYRYAPFCCVCLGCCTAEFGISGRTYELLCIREGSCLYKDMWPVKRGWDLSCKLFISDLFLYWPELSWYFNCAERY